MRDVYNTSRQDNKLPKGFNEGIVTLIYKKGSRTDVRNYRPITLLNGDYKVLTRILAKRMLNLVSQCVSPEQIGFMPRTFIAESCMLIDINLLKVVGAVLPRGTGPVSPEFGHRAKRCEEAGSL